MIAGNHHGADIHSPTLRDRAARFGFDGITESQDGDYLAIDRKKQRSRRRSCDARGLVACAGVDTVANLSHQAFIAERDLFPLMVGCNALPWNLLGVCGSGLWRDVSRLRARGDGSRQWMRRSGGGDRGERQRTIVVAVERIN